MTPIQEMVIELKPELKGWNCSLAALRELHRANGFKGPCIVWVHPIQYQYIVGMSYFRFIDDYRATKPIHPEEFGMSEMFHFVMLAPVEYEEYE